VTVAEIVAQRLGPKDVVDAENLSEMTAISDYDQRQVHHKDEGSMNEVTVLIACITTTTTNATHDRYNVILCTIHSSLKALAPAPLGMCSSKVCVHRQKDGA